MTAVGPGRVKTREVLTVCLIYAWQSDYWRISLIGDGIIIFRAILFFPIDTGSLLSRVKKRFDLEAVAPAFQHGIIIASGLDKRLDKNL